MCLVTTLVTALKNIAIYPPSHPRVTSAAAEFVALLGQRCADRRSCVVVARGSGLVVDEDCLDPDGSGIDWLLQRCREAGLRGAEFQATCTIEDVLAFAVAFNQARPRSGATFFSHWPLPNPRLVPLPLLFQGHHDPDAVASHGAGQPSDAPTAASYLSPKAKSEAQVRAVVDRMAGTPTVRNKLASIERLSQSGGPDDTQKLDLFETIVELLPADVATDPTVIEDVVSRILSRVEESLGELVRKKARVKGADLLRKALGVARKYFHTEAPKQRMPAGMPTGRPEDEKIVADLGLLLQEIDALPDATDLRLPAAAEMASTSSLVAREIFGICLHAVATSDKPTAAEKLRERLRKARTATVLEVADLLAAYAGTSADPSAAGMATRQRVLAILLESGHGELLRSRGFVDAAFLTRGFPEALPLAARVLGADEAGRAVLREGLDSLLPILQAGGGEAAEAAGVLADPEVVRTLASTGGPVAASLLVQAASKAQPAIRQVLQDHLRTKDLPPPEATVVHSYETAEAVPRDYLHSLMIAVTQNRFDAHVHTASGELLRRRATAKDLSHEQRLVAIANLATVPCGETAAMLRRLAADGRWFRFGWKARAIRSCATATLARIREQEQP